MCFDNCKIYFTKNFIPKDFGDFIKKEKYPSGGVTSARIQPFRKKIIPTLVVLMERE